MKIYHAIKDELEKKSNVVIVRKYEMNYIKENKLYGGTCAIKYFLIVAPKEGLYTVEELQEFMVNLISPDIIKPAAVIPCLYDPEIGGSNVGHLVFNEAVGEVTIEEKIRIVDKNLLKYAPDFVPEGSDSRCETKKEDITVCVEIWPFFDAISAWHITDTVVNGLEASLMLDRHFSTREIEKFKLIYKGQYDLSE